MGGTEAPTPASKWIAATRPYQVYRGLHWATWLPLRALRRHVWVQWMWGIVRWAGCSPPWEKTKVLCPVCSQWHPGTLHARLVHYSAWSPVFLREWVRTWGPWEDMAQRWLDQASPEDPDHISKLRIPQSFIDTVPREKLRELRYRVAWHQYHMMHATTLLRQSLPMPPRTDGSRSNADNRSTPVWYTKLRRRVVSLNPDNTTLRAQVHYKPREGGRNKRGPKRPRSSPSYILQQPYSNSTACTLLRLLSSLSPPLQARVHDYVSSPSTPSNLGPRRPPLVHRGLPGEIFLMRSVAQLHTLWRDIRRELHAHYRSYTLLIHMACKTTVWLRAMVSAWRAPLLSARYLFRTSCFQGAMHAKMNMARALLTYHNYTLSTYLHSNWPPPSWGYISVRHAPSGVPLCTMHPCPIRNT